MNLISMVFRFLHLSDIHYMVDPDTDRVRNTVLDKLRGLCSNQDNSINCVVITGDFFQQGQYLSNGLNARHSCISFLREVCEICLPSSLRDNWKDHVIFCPGNHDIDRAAILPSETHKSILTRKTVLKDAVNSSQHRIFSADAEKYRLLTNNTFWLFQKAICEDLQPDCIGDFEYRVFEKKVDIFQRIVFVSINTALYSGQTREKNEIKKELFESRKYLQAADDQNYPDSDYKEPTEQFKKYLELHRELINGEANDKGKLCFISVNSEDALKQTLNTINGQSVLSPIYIFLGHHPLAWFSEGAKKEFAKFAEQYSKESIIYLCGHEHRPAVRKTSVEYNGTDSINVLELEVGGDFADSNQWNIPSFAIEEITIEENGMAHLAGRLFCWCKYLENNTIEFAINQKYAYGWQEIEFGGREKIILRDAGNTETIDPHKIKHSETIDDPEKKEETINDSIIDTEKRSREEIIEPYYDTPSFGNIDF